MGFIHPEPSAPQRGADRGPAVQQFIAAIQAICRIFPPEPLDEVSCEAGEISKEVGRREVPRDPKLSNKARMMGFLRSVTQKAAQSVRAAVHHAAPQPQAPVHQQPQQNVQAHRPVEPAQDRKVRVAAGPAKEPPKPREFENAMSAIERRRAEQLGRALGEPVPQVSAPPAAAPAPEHRAAPAAPKPAPVILSQADQKIFTAFMKKAQESYDQRNIPEVKTITEMAQGRLSSPEAKQLFAQKIQELLQS